ncbi:MAG: methyltransferase domain-containing protein [Thermoplasmata archaeon]|nr:methyltransferase domain-containing protein [Thermoplasmata archaeon]
MLDLQAGQTVADLGTGVGYLVREILRRIGPQGRLYLADIDSENLEWARARLKGDPRVTIQVGPASRRPEIADSSVDRVVLSLVLCCLADKEGVMAEAWRILRAGGQVYVSYPRRRRSVSRRRSSLRVTPERWASLETARGWEVLPVRPSWIVTRHLLRRPKVTGPGG